MLAEIDPVLAVLFNVPMVTGAANEPLASDNWAVYMLPLLKFPVEVNATLNDDDEVVLLMQNGP